MQEVRTKNDATLGVLQIINPVAACLLDPKIDISYEVEDIINRLQDALSVDSATQRRNGAP